MPWRLRLLGVSFAVAAAACALLAGSVQGAKSTDCSVGVSGWSADGKRLVFKGYLNARQEDYGWGGIVGIVNADGTSPRVLSQWPFQHRYESDQDARWAPDGRSVVYEHMRFTGTDSHGGFLFASDFTQVDLRTGARFVVRG